MIVIWRFKYLYHNPYEFEFIILYLLITMPVLKTEKSPPPFSQICLLSLKPFKNDIFVLIKSSRSSKHHRSVICCLFIAFYSTSGKEWEWSLCLYQKSLGFWIPSNWAEQGFSRKIRFWSLAPTLFIIWYHEITLIANHQVKNWAQYQITDPKLLIIKVSSLSWIVDQFMYSAF